MTITELDNHGTSRRRILKTAALVGGGAWVAPFIASSPAHAACPATQKCLPTTPTVTFVKGACPGSVNGVNYTLTITTPTCPCVTPATVLDGTSNPSVTATTGSGTVGVSAVSPASATFNFVVAGGTGATATFTGSMIRTVTCRDQSGDTITLTLNISISVRLTKGNNNDNCPQYIVNSATATPSYSGDTCTTGP